MKRSWKVASGCRLTLVFVLLLAAAAWTVSISAAEEPAGQKSGQTVIKPLPAAPVPHADKKPETEAKKASLQLSPIVKETIELLASPRFTFLPDKALDPFVPFVSLQPSTGNEAPQASGPLTPLQKMTLAEMAKGLKAIAWGALGRMAVIQDSTGKGYIVGVGTPAGPNGGVITQISSNCLVIQQEVWNSQTRKRVPENFTVKMVKKGNESL